ncbi:Hypothetical predicted protein [Paramuricea clavata]|uniref:Uncharacterized protein n=1 Tax=Paramuricea clavata TaxID=317549 RepID=A0A7D9HSR2_PARCT|nr:Hypothetical predicted protein [Paramuricea clavata]
MMGTVKKMFESYGDGKEKYHKRLTELQLGLNTTIYDLEKQVMDTPELRDRLPDIEMNIRTVGAGILNISYLIFVKVRNYLPKAKHIRPVLGPLYCECERKIIPKTFPKNREIV